MRQAEADAQRIQADAEEKRIADDKMAKINAGRDQAKIQADIELTLRELESRAQAQASTSSTVDPPPCNRLHWGRMLNGRQVKLLRDTRCTGMIDTRQFRLIADGRPYSH